MPPAHPPTRARAAHLHHEREPGRRRANRAVPYAVRRALDAFHARALELYSLTVCARFPISPCARARTA
jgi:hypothetical protein